MTAFLGVCTFFKKIVKKWGVDFMISTLIKLSLCRKNNISILSKLRGFICFAVSKYAADCRFWGFNRLQGHLQGLTVQDQSSSHVSVWYFQIPGTVFDRFEWFERAYIICCHSRALQNMPQIAILEGPAMLLTLRLYPEAHCAWPELFPCICLIFSNTWYGSWLFWIIWEGLHVLLWF